MRILPRASHCPDLCLCCSRYCFSGAAEFSGDLLRHVSRGVATGRCCNPTHVEYPRLGETSGLDPTSFGCSLRNGKCCCEPGRLSLPCAHAQTCRTRRFFDFFAKTSDFELAVVTHMRRLRDVTGKPDMGPDSGTGARGSSGSCMAPRGFGGQDWRQFCLIVSGVSATAVDTCVRRPSRRTTNSNCGVWPRGVAPR